MAPLGMISRALPAPGKNAGLLPNLDGNVWVSPHKLQDRKAFEMELSHGRHC